MPDIDLTPMNEAAARALFAEEQVARAENAAGQLDLTAEETAEFLVSTRDEAKAYWDAGELDGSAVITYRERALAVTLASWKDIARQAWQQGHETPRDHVVDLTLGGEDAQVIVGPPQPNPYDPTMTTDDGGPLGD